MEIYDTNSSISHHKHSLKSMIDEQVHSSDIGLYTQSEKGFYTHLSFHSSDHHYLLILLIIYSNNQFTIIIILKLCKNVIEMKAVLL